MTDTAFRTFPAAGVAALFDEAPGGGDPTDINALRNRPALDPEAWLANVYLHNLLDNMEVASDTVVEIAHGAIGTVTLTADGTGSASPYDTDPTQVDFDLVTHGLGYEPLVLVALGGVILTPGYPVQLPAAFNGSGRYCCPFVTTTKVRLHECRSRGNAALPAVTLSYEVLVIRQARPASGNKLLEFDPATGILSLGRDTFNSGRRYLQVVPGGSPFGLTLGRSMDAARGAPRFVAADGTIFDPVPNTTTMWFSDGPQPPSEPYSYNGSFTGGGAILVQAP